MPIPGIDPEKIETRRIEKDNVEKKLEIVEAENGFVIYLTTTVFPKEEFEEMKRTVRVSISKKHPFRKGQKKADSQKSINDAIKKFNDF